MKFSYSLQSVLEYKKQIEDSKKEGLITANQQLDQENKVLDEISCTHEKTMNTLNQKPFDIQEQKHYVQYILNLESQIKDQQIRVNDCEQLKETAREQLSHAQKERKIMESLEEKELNRYLKEIKTKEEKELNEIATIGYARNKKRLSNL